MKARKIAIGAIAAVLMAGSGVTNAAYAAEVGGQAAVNTNIDFPIITPYWANILEITPMLSASGTMLYPSVYIEAMKTTGKISGTMYLEKYYSGQWIRVNSWTISGTNYVLLSKSHEGMSGSTYRTKVSVTIDGESAEAVSVNIGI